MLNLVLIDSEGSALKEERLPKKPTLLEMLRRMIRIRLFEEKASAIRLPAGLPGVLHNCIGQEAEIVGSCVALRADDYMTGNHRSHGHPIGKGAKLPPLMAELFGKSTGICRGRGGSMHLADFSVGSLGESGIVGSLIPIAVGAGLSALMRGTDQVCLCFFGDGAANCGPFHESLNLAAIWKIPVIFLCENNGYAIHSSHLRSCAVVDIADRADAYGIPGAVVDGQDVLAVHGAVTGAIARARRGDGPSLIEAKTYRYCEHCEFGPSPPDPPPYRETTELAQWRARDPIRLFLNQLLTLEILTESEFHKIAAEVATEIEEAVTFAQNGPMPDPAELQQGVFAITRN